MSTPHTPVPWRYTSDSQGAYVQAGDTTLARLTLLDSIAETDANGEVMAAAPELRRHLAGLAHKVEVGDWAGATASLRTIRALLDRIDSPEPHA